MSLSFIGIIRLNENNIKILDLSIFSYYFFIFIHSIIKRINFKANEILSYKRGK